MRGAGSPRPKAWATRKGESKKTGAIAPEGQWLREVWSSGTDPPGPVRLSTEPGRAEPGELSPYGGWAEQRASKSHGFAWGQVNRPGPAAREAWGVARPIIRHGHACGMVMG